MLAGRSANDLMTASPRKILVPGVHACAPSGTSISATRTARAIAHGLSRPVPRLFARGCISVGVLDADALALTANRFAKILDLVGYDVVYRLACVIEVLANLIRHFIDRNAVHQLLALFACAAPSALGVRRGPPRAFRRAPACPSCACKPHRA